MQPKWLAWANKEEWWVCWIGLICFGAVALSVRFDIPNPAFREWHKTPADAFSSDLYSLPVILAVITLLLTISLACVRKKHWPRFPLGFMVIMATAFVSKVLAKQSSLRNARLGDSIWAILFGAIFTNVVWRKGFPKWLKVAQMTENYISISLVLLCIDISVLKQMVQRAIVVSWIDTPLLFLAMSYFGHKVLRINVSDSIIMSGATMICGSSAAIALATSLKPKGAKEISPMTHVTIAIMSLFTIPAIIGLPFLAKQTGMSGGEAGAFFGGCVDSTGAVLATASIFGGRDARDAAAIVKMLQNLLIAPMSVTVAYFWIRSGSGIKPANNVELKPMSRVSEKATPKDAPKVTEETKVEISKEPSTATLDESNSRSNSTAALPPPATAPAPAAAKKSAATNRDSSTAKLFWDRTPKFVLGFIVTVLFFNTAVQTKHRPETNEFAFTVSEWFSTFSFVTIGMSLNFVDLAKKVKSVLSLVGLYLICQTFDIAANYGLAHLAFLW